MKRIIPTLFALLLASVALADTGAKTKIADTTDAGYAPAQPSEQAHVKQNATVQADYAPPTEQFQPAVKPGAKPRADVHVSHRYDLAYYNPGTAPGSVRDSWTQSYYNLVPDVAINKILDDTYKTKTPDTGFWVGLVTGPGAAGCSTADTMTSHAGWAENVTYSNSTRVAWQPGTVSSKSVTNSSTPAVFNINGSATIGGSFMVSGSSGTADTKSGTGGTIRSCGAFSTGDKAVSNGGTLTVTISATGS